MRINVVLLPLLCGCLLKDFSRGEAALDSGDPRSAIVHLKRALADRDMTREHELRACAMLARAYGELKDPKQALRYLDLGADLLLKDYRILDISRQERDAIDPHVRMRYYWRVGQGALKGLESTRSPELRKEKVALAEIHFRRALSLTGDAPHWREQIQAEWDRTKR